MIGLPHVMSLEADNPIIPRTKGAKQMKEEINTQNENGLLKQFVIQFPNPSQHPSQALQHPLQHPSIQLPIELQQSSQHLEQPLQQL